MSASLRRLNLSKVSVLVVQESATSLDLLSQVLLGFGISQPRKCTTLREGRGLAISHDFDLVLVDQDMSEGPGVGFCRHLRGDPEGRNYTAPIILLVALPSEAMVNEARDAGTNFVLAKPIVPATLLDRIDWIAREKRDFVTSDTYRGPDRRFQSLALPEGSEERRQQMRALAEAPERALSQDEINSLF